jgi:hypothetical protein
MCAQTLESMRANITPRRTSACSVARQHFTHHQHTPASAHSCLPSGLMPLSRALARVVGGAECSVLKYIARLIVLGGHHGLGVQDAGDLAGDVDGLERRQLEGMFVLIVADFVARQPRAAPPPCCARGARCPPPPPPSCQCAGRSCWRRAAAVEGYHQSRPIGGQPGPALDTAWAKDGGNRLSQASIA